MKISSKGGTRVVFILESLPFVIKVARCDSMWLFLKGCLANHQERMYTKLWKDVYPNLYTQIAKTYYVSIFGIISIQQKCIELDRHLFPIEEDLFKDITKDTKKENVGWYKDKLVVFDYG